MIIQAASFDPTATPNGQIPNLLPNLVGFMIVTNDTPANILLQVGPNQVQVKSGFARRINIPPGDGANATTITWYQQSIQSNSGQYPTITINGVTRFDCTVEEYTWDEDQNLRESYPITIPRTQNVGNTVSTSSVQTLVNDGNPAGTGVIEATPSGGSSSLGFRNDGSGYFGGGLIVFNASGIFTSMPAGSVPVAALGTGALPSGISVAEGQVSSGYPANELGAGVLPSGVTIPYAQVTGTPALNYLPLAGGTMSGAIALSDGNTQIGVGLNGDSEFDMQSIGSTRRNISLIVDGGQAITFKSNNKFDGTNDVYTRSGYQAWQMRLDGTGIRLRTSTDAVANAGATITWGPFYPLAAVSYAASAPAFNNWPAGTAFWLNSSE